MDVKPLAWYFRLDGDDFDIRALSDLFKGSSNLRTLADGRLHLVLELPFTSSGAAGALGIAKELLSKLNGIAQTIYGNHDNLGIGSVFSEAEDGRLTHYILPDALTGRSRVFATATVISGGVPLPPHKSIGVEFLDAACRDEHFERALYLYGSLPQDWRCLYMVLEAAEDGTGGEGALITKKWVADGAIKDFKATANSFKALRLQARHGSVMEGVPRPKQTLDDARKMIRAILACWGI
jgi:hypothetical protein